MSVRYDSESGRVLQYQSVKVRELLMMLHVDVAFFCIVSIKWHTFPYICIILRTLSYVCILFLAPYCLLLHTIACHQFRAYLSEPLEEVEGVGVATDEQVT